MNIGDKVQVCQWVLTPSKIAEETWKWAIVEQVGNGQIRVKAADGDFDGAGHDQMFLPLADKGRMWK